MTTYSFCAYLHCFQISAQIVRPDLGGQFSFKRVAAIAPCAKFIKDTPKSHPSTNHLRAEIALAES